MVKNEGECPHGFVPTKHGIGHLSHPRTHPHPKPMSRRRVSPNPLLGLRTLKGGGFGLTGAELRIRMNALLNRISNYSFMECNIFHHNNTFFASYYIIGFIFFMYCPISL
jgi:hypothetical protein